MVSKLLTAEPMLSTSAANQSVFVALSTGVLALLKEYCKVVADHSLGLAFVIKTDVEPLPATPLKNVATVEAFEVSSIHKYRVNWFRL